MFGPVCFESAFLFYHSVPRILLKEFLFVWVGQSWFLLLDTKNPEWYSSPLPLCPPCTVNLWTSPQRYNILLIPLKYLTPTLNLIQYPNPMAKPKKLLGPFSVCFLISKCLLEDQRRLVCLFPVNGDDDLLSPLTDLGNQSSHIPLISSQLWFPELLSGFYCICLQNFGYSCSSKWICHWLNSYQYNKINWKSLGQVECCLHHFPMKPKTKWFGEATNLNKYEFNSFCP